MADILFAARAGTNRAGHLDLRPKHGAVLASVGPTGTRPSELAERAGMTKASMGELVDDLEALGYVLRASDPDDGRARPATMRRMRSMPPTF